MQNSFSTDLQNVLNSNGSQIKNIIFDLGGVIIEIHYNETIKQFKELGFADFETIYTQMKQTRIFDLLETGKIPGRAFRMELRKFQSHLTDEMIDKAWNAMIGEMSVKTFNLVKTLREKYRTFLLSNTNEIHIDYFIRNLNKKLGFNPLPEMFEHTYYSHEIGYRKPNADAYEFVLRNADILPGETIFIDDLEANIIGAKKVGLQTIHLTDGPIVQL